MALELFPNIAKTTKVSDGTTYAYVRVPATDSKPTFVLLHGFPGFSYDWRHVIPRLTAEGYGVIAPDLLGYGDTDKPTDIPSYSFARMASHIVEIVKQEGLDKVIGVGHDWYVPRRPHPLDEIRPLRNLKDHSHLTLLQFA
jgi:soluble epoxide hydrolase / lipid-phosphate phosphatase